MTTNDAAGTKSGTGRRALFRFDPVVTTGNLLTMCGLLAGLIVFMWSTVAKLDRMDYRLGVMWSDFKGRHMIQEPGDPLPSGHSTGELYFGPPAASAKEPIS